MNLDNQIDEKINKSVQEIWFDGYEGGCADNGQVIPYEVDRAIEHTSYNETIKALVESEVRKAVDRVTKPLPANDGINKIEDYKYKELVWAIENVHKLANVSALKEEE